MVAPVPPWPPWPQDHQRRLFLDLASYVDQQLPAAQAALAGAVTPHGAEKRTRFDSEEVVEAWSQRVMNDGCWVNKLKVAGSISWLVMINGG